MKYKVEIAELADHFVVAFKEKDTLRVKKVMKLNRLGTDILRAYMEEVPQEELIPILANRYQSTIENMQIEVSKFYADLAQY
ncbi:MAG: PqqD family peptide modification chaperone [Bacteroidaceae bacterium]|nr:PqqD family peptide modification chaperone [Bacteroidaceae bacterium]